MKGTKTNSSSKEKKDLLETLKSSLKARFSPAVILGALISSLYHVVYSLALASAITRRHGDASLIGLFAKMGVLGAISGASVQIAVIGRKFPSLYPSVDRFMIPLLVELANNVDQSLYEQAQKSQKDPVLYNELLSDETFMATFASLTALGFLLSALCCLLACSIKLANLGAFLPNAVISGFFSTIGLLLFQFAFSVDNGINVKKFFSFYVFGIGDGSAAMISVTERREVVEKCLFHFLPSVVAGMTMRYFSPKYQLSTPILIIVMICCVYLVMALNGISLEEAQNLHWFWNKSELIYHGTSKIEGPPAPLGFIQSLITRRVNRDAFLSGIPTIFATAFIYTLRSSFHSVALLKNTRNMLKGSSKNPRPQEQMNEDNTFPQYESIKNNDFMLPMLKKLSDREENSAKIERTDKVLPDSSFVLFWYAISYITAGVFGGFSCIPSLGAGNTLYRMGASGATPQFFGIIILLFVSYTDFNIVQYVPKMVFSSLLIVSGIDLMFNWFFKSFQRTEQKWEWIVVPFIMVMSYVIGLLEAVAIGIGISFFIFVAAFYQSGVVKFVGNGLTMHSTIERMEKDSDWLEENGDLIQILILQNYIFFGNAYSCQNYISSMFEDTDMEDMQHFSNDFSVPPMPKFIIVDFSLVTGVDTSAVDIFMEILILCKENNCKFYITGLSVVAKEVFIRGGLNVDLDVRYEDLSFNYFSALDSAMGLAEDILLYEAAVEYQLQQKKQLSNTEIFIEEKHAQNDGFYIALNQIDELHKTFFASQLYELKKYTEPISLRAGEQLPVKLKGLFFIEIGQMKVERDLFQKPLLQREGSLLSTCKILEKVDSLGQMNARFGILGQNAVKFKQAKRKSKEQQYDSSRAFRLARYGPGFVVGYTQLITGLPPPGVILAVTNCRLHFLPYSYIDDIEIQHPLTLMHLYKLLARIVFKRYDSSVEQLSVMKNIMATAGLTNSIKPLSRVEIGLRSPSMSNSSFSSFK